MNTKRKNHIISIMKLSNAACAVIVAFMLFTTNVNALDLSGEATYSDSTDIHTVVDQMPEVEGGLSSVYKYIEYPSLATRTKTEGRVFIKFVVDENGNVKNPEILKDIGSGCGEAAIEGIKKVKFKPGVHQGKKVKVYFTMPIIFQLQK